jgi:hypothetical protein
MCLGFLFAFVAQWIEHPPPKGRVARSIRAEGTISESYPLDYQRISAFTIQMGILRKQVNIGFEHILSTPFPYQSILHDTNIYTFVTVGN